MWSKCAQTARTHKTHPQTLTSPAVCGLGLVFVEGGAGVVWDAFCVCGLFPYCPVYNYVHFIYVFLVILEILRILYAS